jgi:hypothetical protein
MGCFSRSSSELLLEVVDEDGGIVRSARSGANDRDGLGRVGKKLAGGETKMMVLSSSKGSETW